MRDASNEGMFDPNANDADGVNDRSVNDANDEAASEDDAGRE